MRNKYEDLGTYIQTVEQANKSFYLFEEDQYPDGDSPYSDEGRGLYVAGYVQHWRECRDEVERCIE